MAPTALSPSRAADFMACPLLYRFRVIDQLPEAPSIGGVRGTVVHAVLEGLFDLPAADRTHDRRATLLLPQLGAGPGAEEPELAELFGGRRRARLATWLDQCRAAARSLLRRSRTRSASSRPSVRSTSRPRSTSGLTLHGYIDRVDVAPTGEVRIVDYKTGESPGEHFEAKALFQMKFYALVVWRTRGVIPRMLQLVYLGNAEMLRYEPDERDLLATERKVQALWDAIQRATETGDLRPNKSVLCGWCDHQAICPAWGGARPRCPSTRCSAPSTLRSPGRTRPRRSRARPGFRVPPRVEPG